MGTSWRTSLSPGGGLRLRSVPSVPSYSACSAWRCRRTSWLERRADCAVLICRGELVGLLGGKVVGRSPLLAVGCPELPVREKERGDWKGWTHVHGGSRV